MTFTSIPPSLRPVVEDVAREIAEKLGFDPPYHWTGHVADAEAAILAFLNACVERGVGKTANGLYEDDGWAAYSHDICEEPGGGDFKSFLFNLGATDDTA